jgi:hypothetical protein
MNINCTCESDKCNKSCYGVYIEKIRKVEKEMFDFLEENVPENVPVNGYLNLEDENKLKCDIKITYENIKSRLIELMIIY